MQLRETLDAKYQIKLNEIEILEPVGSGRIFFLYSHNLHYIIYL